MDTRSHNFARHSMVSFRLLIALLPAVLLFMPARPAVAVTWQEPTPEELSMTADPTAPGEDGVYLFREEIGDDKNNFHSLYVRLKVLTEEGKQKYADVEMPVFDRGHYRIADVQGRTIHRDGTVVPFVGKPIDKLIVKTKERQYHTSVMTMPDVQVGSILEYRYALRYDDNYAYSPTWIIQQEIPVRSAHYRFVPTSHILNTGRGSTVEGQLAYSPQLPAGATVQYIPSANVYELRMEKIPAMPKEEFMPPMESLSYRVAFYYTAVRNVEQYWKEEGKYWSKDLDRFASAGKVEDALRGIVQPSDSPQQKVQKIYDAVMLLENTSFTREHTAAENKAEGFRIKNAGDIWTQKRGNADEITMLFIALVRAAGLKAYGMAVTNRDNTIFRVNYLSMNQLDDDIAIVEVDGKEQFFDPGQRYCAFGQLHWKHTLSEGLRQTEQGTVIAESSGVGYKDDVVSRVATLSLGPAGEVTGSIRVVLTGADALRWRQKALTTDAEEVKKDFQEELQEKLPVGVEVKTNHFIGLTDWKTVLMVQLDVTGTLGTATSKRVFLPSSFFESRQKPLFAHEKRELPVDLRFPYQLNDVVTLKLPAAMIAESVPKDTQLSLPKRAIYGTKYKADGNVFTVGRTIVMATSFFDVKEYPELRDFYQKVNAQDQEQLILKTAASAPTAGAGQ